MFFRLRIGWRWKIGFYVFVVSEKGEENITGREEKEEILIKEEIFRNRCWVIE